MNPKSCSGEIPSKFYTFVSIISQLNPALFWDTDISSLSETEHSGFIIQRLCMFGSWEDWLLLKDTYGLPTIEQELLSARYLDKKRSTISALFSINQKITSDAFRLNSQPKGIGIIKRTSGSSTA
ncbi:MAG: hypothetical protein IPP51_07720 [Bacteroidetes bacterium]|nr:hypothetical protein [Bacteroidota bacterium]